MPISPSISKSRIAACFAAAAFLLAVGQASASQRAAEAPLSTYIRADTQKVVLAVKGMVCESCERTVNVMLARTPGVIRATVTKREVVVLYDPALTAPAKLIAVIERLGYEAVIAKA